MTQQSELEQAARSAALARFHGTLWEEGIFIKAFLAGARYRTDRILELLRQPDVKIGDTYWLTGNQLADFLELKLGGDRG